MLNARRLKYFDRNRFEKLTLQLGLTKKINKYFSSFGIKSQFYRIFEFVTEIKNYYIFDAP